MRHAAVRRDEKTGPAQTGGFENLRQRHTFGDLPAGGVVEGTNDMSRSSAKIELKNVNHPGQVRLVDANMYDAMRQAFLKVLPKAEPGLTVVEVQERVVPLLPEGLFPGGARAGWWAKAVQLDLEAKGMVRREKTSPLRLHKT